MDDKIKIMIKAKMLRKKHIDKEKVKSLINSVKIITDVVSNIKLDKKTATIIFRELYESIRQLGEVHWIVKGYEPATHDASLESLKTLNIKNKLKLNHLDRFRKIRNDSNYRGFIISEEQAKEIIDFWNTAGKEILKLAEES